MKLALYEPEIPPNTGNIARLCAAFNIELNLIEPLGFLLDDRYLKRAGLDYWPNVKMKLWKNFNIFFQSLTSCERLVLATTHGNVLLQNFSFRKNDIIVLGPETRGLPDHVFNYSQCYVRIPSRRMENGGVRSLNLATAAGIFLFTAMNNCGLLQNIE